MSIKIELKLGSSYDFREMLLRACQENVSGEGSRQIYFRFSDNYLTISTYFADNSYATRIDINARKAIKFNYDVAETGRRAVTFWCTWDKLYSGIKDFSDKEAALELSYNNNIESGSIVLKELSSKTAMSKVEIYFDCDVALPYLKPPHSNMPIYSLSFSTISKHLKLQANRDSHVVIGKDNEDGTNVFGFCINETCYCNDTRFHPFSISDTEYYSVQVPDYILSMIKKFNTNYKAFHARFYVLTNCLRNGQYVENIENVNTLSNRENYTNQILTNGSVPKFVCSLTYVDYATISTYFG
jgi:hypothetical protein